MPPKIQDYDKYVKEMTKWYKKKDSDKLNLPNDTNNTRGKIGIKNTHFTSKVYIYKDKYKENGKKTNENIKKLQKKVLDKKKEHDKKEKEKKDKKKKDDKDEKTKKRLEFNKKRQSEIKKQIKKLGKKEAKKIQEEEKERLEKEEKKIKQEELTQKTKDEKNLDMENKCYRMKKIEIFPNEKQKEFIKKSMDECTKVYNACVDKFANDKHYFDAKLKNKSDIFDSIYKGEKKPASYDMLSDEYKKFLANLESNYTQIKKGYKKTFTMHHKNTEKSQSVLMPKASISSIEEIDKKKKKYYIVIFPFLCPNKGKILCLEKVNNIDDCDCRLIHDKVQNSYYILSPQKKIKKVLEDRQPVVACDPGGNKFLAFYSDSKFGYIGGNTYDVIEKQSKKIQDSVGGIMSGKNVFGEKLRNKKRLKMKRLKQEQHLVNQVKELHNQAALYLCKKYDTIVLPQFRIQWGNVKKKIQEIKKSNKSENEKRIDLKKLSKERYIERKRNKIMMKLGHYKFSKHLKAKCEEYGCELVTDLTEEFTSQMCSKCGSISKKYTKRRKECEKCGYKIDRDVNGSRNIYLKYLKSKSLI